MYLHFLIVAISLTGAICESEIENVLDDSQEETHRQRRSNSATVYEEFLVVFDTDECNIKGLHRNNLHIIVLCASDKSVRIHKVTSPFELVKRINSAEFVNPSDIVASVSSNCLYVYSKPSILKITLASYEVTQWLRNLEDVNKITASADGEVAVQSGYFDVNVYSENALFKRYFLLKRISDSTKTDSKGRMVILKPNEEYISVQKAYNDSHTFYVISLLTAGGGQTSREVSVVVDKSTERCWSFVVGAGGSSNARCFTPRHDAYLLLEGNVLKLHVQGAESGVKSILLLDVKLSFGINPAATDSLEFHII